MTLLDYPKSHGRVRRIAECEAHTRLVDMGLVGAEFEIRVKKRGAMLIDFFGESWHFSAVLDRRAASRIIVGEGAL